MSKPACPGSGISAPGCRGSLRSAAHALLGALIVAILSSATFVGAEAQDAVDATLILAVDVSGSIDSREFVLQRQGYIKALTDKRFINAVKGGEHQAIAVGYFEWTGPGMNAPVYECALIRDEADAQKFADQIASTPRLLYGGGTGVGEAIYAAIAMHERCAYKTERRVIDVSGDGRTNRGRRAGPARDQAVEANMTVNGLAIINEEPDLEDYYRSEVMGGTGAFVAVVNDFETFEDAVIAKLVREISSPNVPAKKQHADAGRR